jgi:type IV pilus assembly protein PilQ
VGEPRQVGIATSLLTKLDARRRQVAINVKVVDINLDNLQDFSASFSFGVNDSFFVQDQGSATIRFGTQSPARGIDIDGDLGRVSNPPIINNPFSGGQTFIDPTTGTLVPGISGSTIFNNADGTINLIPQRDPIFFNRNLGVLNNPFGTGITDFTRGTDDVFTQTLDPETGIITTEFERGTFPEIIQAVPDFLQYPRRFLALIETEIQSGNAKVLTDPTLVVQEGQEATVKLTQKVIESVGTSVDPLSGVRTTTPVLADAGLTLVVNVDKVDDNGFVNLSVSPTVAAVGAQQEFDSGDGTVNILNLLNRRELTSGLVRLRDGQTLILSGVIQESDRTITSKVPILGDIPILGALFRSTSDETQRTEVVIVVTPQIMDDNAQFGYNYAPGREAADVLRRRGYQIPSQ